MCLYLFLTLVLQTLHSKQFFLCGSLLQLTSCFPLTLSEDFGRALLRSVLSGVVDLAGELEQFRIVFVVLGWLLRPAGGAENVLVNPEVGQL